MIHETNVSLNVQEVGILLSALKLLEFEDECVIAKDYGSVCSLYNRLKDIYDGMDSTICGPKEDPICEPSY
jgi:hypothetical protein|tara:strand:+ start:656 stop:868 length:213 start_codon:yes stop_codon:yes gene_type:complete